MEYRALGRSGLQVSSICLGCMTFGNQTNAEDSAQIIHAAIENGINFVDTANAYTKGASEEIVGDALSQGGRRDKVVLASKASNPLSKWPNDGGSTRYHLMRQCEASLKRLRTDRIDLYQLHWMDLSTPLEESMRALDDLVRQGKVLYTGCSKFASAWLVEAIMLCERNGWVKFISEQPPYSLLDRSIDNELIWTCIRHGVGIIPWAPLGTGILSGKYKASGSQPADARFKEFNDRLTPKALERAEALRPLAGEKGVSLGEMSLAWVRQQPGITSPIIGTRTMEQLNSALRSTEISFTPDELKRIDQIAPPGSAVSDYYDGNVYASLRRRSGLERK